MAHINPVSSSLVPVVFHLPFPCWGNVPNLGKPESYTSLYIPTSPHRSFNRASKLARD